MTFDVWFAIIWPPFLGVGLPAVIRSRPFVPVWPVWLIGAGGDLAGAVWAGDWRAAVASGANAAVALAAWWWSRRRRGPRRAYRAYGAKSRELVAKVVRAGRDAQRSRPRLRPVPGGAGW